MTATHDSLQALLDSITPEIHDNLKAAVETGRWSNGDRLTPQQLEHSLQAIIAYEARYVPEQQRVGYIDTSALQKSHCDEPGHTHAEPCATEDDVQAIVWKTPGSHSTH